MKQIRTYFIFPYTHPLFYCLAGLVSGIYSQYTWDYFIYLQTLVTVMLFACSYLHYKKVFFTTTIVMISTALGAYLYATQIQQEHDFYAITAQKKYAICGRVEIIETSSHHYLKTKINLSLLQVFDSTWSEIEPSPFIGKTIQLYVPYKKFVQIGDIIALNELVFTMPQNYEYRRYLMKENISANVFLTSFNPYLVYRPPIDIYRWLTFHKKRILSSFCRKYPGARAYLFSSVFLGNKTDDFKKADLFKEWCTVWGINHYLARSGLHLIVFIMLWSFIFSFIPLHYNIKQIGLTLLSIVYAFLSWSSISFNRALYVFILYKVCIIRSDQPHFLYLLGLVSCVVLINNPMLLFFLDFQLSFGITFALAWYNKLQKQKMLLSERTIS